MKFRSLFPLQLYAPKIATLALYTHPSYVEVACWSAASFSNDVWGKQVNILKLTLAVLEEGPLHHALVNKGIQTIIKATYAYTKHNSQLAPHKIWTAFQDTQAPKIDTLLHFSRTTSHGGSMQNLKEAY